MPRSRLKKLVFRKESALVTEVINALDVTLCVQDDLGQYLIGPTQPASNLDDTNKAAITVEGDTIGWVSGSPLASTAAKLLAQMAQKEIEKRAITQDLLAKYKEISLLFRLSEQIVETLDIHEIATLVLDEAKQLLPSDQGMLMLLRETTRTLERIATFNIDTQATRPIALGQGLIGKIAATSRAEIVETVETDARFVSAYDMGPYLNTESSESFDKERNHQTLICVPLKTKDRLIGVIALQREATDAYRSADLKLLTALSTHVASVISVLRHEKQLKESRQNELIFQLSSQIRDSLGLEKTLQTAVHKIRAALDCDRCFFLWHRSDIDASLPTHLANYQPTQEHLAIVSESRISSLPTIADTYDIDEIGTDIITHLYQQKTLQINNVDALPMTPFTLFLQGHQCEALLAVPMMTRAGQAGLLCCGSMQPRHWELDEVNLLQAVTNQLIIAIDQAELYEHSRHTGQLAEEKAQELEQALTKLKTLQLQLVQTEKMSSLGQMVAGIAHEINNPVSFIHGNLSHLEQNVKDLLYLLDCYQEEMSQPSEVIEEAIEEVNLDFLAQDVPKLLESMAMGTQRIREIVLSLRTFAQLDQAEYKQTDIHKGLDSALLLVQHRLHSADNKLDKPDMQRISMTKQYGNLPLVSCYPNQLNQVFTHLINNALDALEGSSQSDKVLSITTECLEHQAVVRIVDNGPGISNAIKHKIFDPFFTTKSVGQGTGLGLSISYQIVTARHQGQLECHSQPGQGCEFVMTIPIDSAATHHSNEHSSSQSHHLYYETSATQPKTGREPPIAAHR